jgi:phytoene dehydrogenase-like protein
MDESTKQEIIDAYVEANPTPDNTMEIVVQLAEEYDMSSNALRLMLSKAGVYVKKAPTVAVKKATTGTKAGAAGVAGGRKPGKADVVAKLVALAKEKGVDILTEEQIAKFTIAQMNFIFAVSGIETQE